MDLDALHKKFTRAEGALKFVTENGDELKAMLDDWRQRKAAAEQPEAPQPDGGDAA